MATMRHLERAAALCTAILTAGCTLLFPGDFSDRVVVTRGPIYEGMVITAVAEGRDDPFARYVSADSEEPETLPELSLTWRGQPGWPRARVGRMEISERRIAFELRLPPDLPMGAGADNALEIFVDGDSYGSLDVLGLPEATLGDTITVDELAPLYTRVTIDQDLTVEVLGEASNRPVRIRTTSSVTVGDVTLSVAAAGATGGPGACVRDCPGTPAEEGPAGHDEATADGTAYGEPTLLDLSRAGGSPGGGDTAGGGGGVLELTTLGHLDGGTFFDSARGVADGADGASGGGSGGSVLVRVREGPSGFFYSSVEGGGEASNGYVRFDSPSGDFGGSSQGGESSAFYRGPMFRDVAIPEPNDPSPAPSPRLIPSGQDRWEVPFRAQQPSSEGDASGVVAVLDIDGDTGQDVEVRHVGDLEYTASFDVIPGRIHRLCLLPRGADEISEDLFHEKQNCMDLAAP